MYSKRIATSLFLAGVSASAFAADYKVEATSSASGVKLKFETTAEQTSVCVLQNKAVTLVRPGGPATGLGSITLTAKRNLADACLTVLGPHVGEIELPFGEELPSLPDGEYALSINGSKQGTLVIEKGSASIK